MERNPLTCAVCGKGITREMAARREAVSFRGKPHCASCVPAQGASPAQTLQIVEEGVAGAPVAGAVRARDTVAAAEMIVEAPAPRAPAAHDPHPSGPVVSARTTAKSAAWDGAERRRFPRAPAAKGSGPRKGTTTSTLRKGGAQRAGASRKNLPLIIAGGGTLVVVIALIVASSTGAPPPARGAQGSGGETPPPPVASDEVAAILRQAETAHEAGRSLFSERKYREAHPRFEQARDLYRRVIAMKPSIRDGVESRLEDLQRDLINCERNVGVGGGGAE
ncbi:MAG: hypothetical protein HY608_01045 [Planctomycetes bacterium]|nr:hypothetical protein [Planctomycetota bacterium]